jgi:cellulose biosynthesis protein BcsQ
MNALAGKFVTFYSYKGGTGRSMLLANLAWLLASNGRRVLVIDWDLEAPGLHRYFRPFLVDPDLTETDGLIDAFWAFASHAMGEESRAMSQPGNFEATLKSKLELEDFVTPVEWRFAGDGCIDLVGAGRQGATYSERVNSFDWKRFYQMGGGSLLERARQAIATQYDFVLIDSRTGVSDTSGICTIQLPDTLVACFTLNRQSIDGVSAILGSAVKARAGLQQSSPSTFPSRPPIATFPVATRIENSEKERLDAARTRARQTLEKFVPETGEKSERGTRDYWDGMEVTYRPFYAYEEVLAAFGDIAGAGGSATTLLSEMERIGRTVFRMPQLAMPEIPEADRRRVLAKYAFGTVIEKKATAPVTTGPETPDELEFFRDLYAKEVIWRNNGYRYRDLLSRRELQLITPEERSKFGRNMTFYHANSGLAAGFRGRATAVFGMFWISFVLLVLLSVFLPGLIGYFRDSPGYLNHDTATQVTGALLIVVWFAAAFGALILYRSDAKPYGLSLLTLLFFCVLGPLAPEIKDYRRPSAA